jgi:hypothetical protein
MSLHDLEQAVTQLPKSDLEAFTQWFESYLAQTWDEQIEADVAAGRLDAVGERAEDDFKAGRCTPL